MAEMGLYGFGGPQSNNRKEADRGIYPAKTSTQSSDNDPDRPRHQATL